MSLSCSGPNSCSANRTQKSKIVCSHVLVEIIIDIDWKIDFAVLFSILLTHVST
jgi:hypothetical protein